MDPRKILGVAADASEEEIRKAFREKAKKHHPDLGGDAWAFQQVQEAYDALIGGEAKSSLSDTTAESAGTSKTKSRETNPEKGSSRRESDVPSGNPYRTPKQTPRQKKKASLPEPERPKTLVGWLTGELPLQNETTYFILVNCLDIFFTYILLRHNAMEANPIANFFYHQWGFAGMIAFKLVIVAVVCVIAQVVAFEKIKSARFLLIVGTILVAMVNVYSVSLFVRNFM